MTGTSMATWLLMISTVPGSPVERQEIQLNGPWQYKLVSELDTPPKAGDWQAIHIPGTLRGFNYERAWFRRSFRAPTSMRGSRITIRFDGIKYNSRIFVNGRQVGGCFNGYDAFEVDATDAVRFDGPNQLDVGCHDWTGVFSEGKFDFSKKPAWQRPRRYVTDKVIAPIGGHYDSYGIWGDVVLSAHPAVYVKDLFIKPSVRNSELVIEYTVANESDIDADVDLRATVVDHGEDLLRVSPIGLKVPAGQSVKGTLKQAWPNAHYWSHEDPYLYHLRTDLSTGDRLQTRFGFREFWIEGHRYFLNGSKINLLATSWWPPTEAMTRAEVKRQWLALKKAGIVCFRTHTQPWRRVHYDVADEVGLLMIIEGAMWHDPYCTRYDDPRYWDNYSKMIHAMLDREKNRPSVIMWSMENEAYAGEEKTKLAKVGLARVGRMAKQWDPTRPIYFESDGDPGGVADAVGLHYVHEYPRYTCWPNEAYWLNKPIKPRTWFGSNEGSFLWNKEKPLYLGEFLWVPSGTPAAHTVFFGDDAYRDLAEYTRRAKAEAWKMQILAFRHDEAGGMCPWSVGTDLDESNPLYRAHQYAYQPLAAYCHNYDRRFYSGESVTRNVEIFNDRLSGSELVLTWTLSLGNQTIARGSKPVKLEAGEKHELEVTLPMPDVDMRRELDWQLTLTRNDVTVFTDRHRYSVFPSLRINKPAAVLGLYDPQGSTARLLQRLHVPFQQVTSLHRIADQVELLVIGDGTLAKERHAAPTIGRTDPQRGAIMGFLARGGRLLVLRQEVYPEGLFDLEPTPQQSTMTFPLRPHHPALKGLKADDLKFWRGDHMVADHELPRPSVGSAISIITSGSDTGISHAPLLERPLGKSCIMHCQLRLVEKALTEPAAGVILANLLEYLGAYQPEARRTAVIGADAGYRESLSKLGLRFDEISADEPLADLSGYSLVICQGEIRGSSGLATQLGNAVKDGANLLVHRPAPETIEWIAKGMPLDVSVRPHAGSIKRAEGDDRLLEALTREDLYWTVKRPGLSWARQPLSDQMIDCIFEFDKNAGQSSDVRDGRDGNVTALTSPPALITKSYHDGRIVLDGIRWNTEEGNGRKAARHACSLLTALDADFTPRSAVTLECERMTPQAEMNFFHTEGSTAYMGCNGFIKTNVHVAKSQRYSAELVASGDSSEAICPLVEVRVDGNKVAEVQLTAEGWRSYRLEMNLSRGDHELSIWFMNDHSSPSGDRNLRLDKLVVYNDPIE